MVNQDDIEEGWRNHVQKVIEEANNQTILITFVSFGKLFDELKVRYSEKATKIWQNLQTCFAITKFAKSLICALSTYIKRRCSG